MEINRRQALQNICGSMVAASVFNPIVKPPTPVPLRPKLTAEQRQKVIAAIKNLWQSHSMCMIEPVWIEGKVSVMFRNSWGSS